MTNYDLLQDVRTLINALEAALRWPYDPTIKDHAAFPNTIGADFDDRYKMDMHDIHAGLVVIQRTRAEKEKKP